MGMVLSRPMRALTASLLGLVIAGQLTACAASVGVSGATHVAKDSASTCSGLCSDLGMALSAVVVMANNVGCVCTSKHAASLDDKAASASGGMAAIAIQEEEQRRQQESHH
jgi:hypothetical protein